MHSAIFCLSKSSAHNIFRNPRNFNIHLQGRNTVISTSNFKVHITEMIFITQNIRQNRKALAFKDEAHRNTGDWAADWNTRIHHRKRGTANRCHG